MQYTLVKIFLALILFSSGSATGMESTDVASTTDEDLWAAQTIENMTLAQKIGQMIVTGLDGTSISDEERRMIENGQVGGLIFLGHNVEGQDQFRSLVESLPDSLEIPLFLEVDQEGGRVQRLPLDKGDFPSAMEIGQKADQARAFGLKLGNSVQDFGLNVNLAPVLDIFSNPENKVIGNRAYGKTPEHVSRVGVDVMLGIQESGVVACVKHFPGHGDTSVDSHEGLPVIYHDLDRLKTFEWVPFKRAVDAGADMIMTAHVLIPAIDEDEPATMSRALLTDYLRGELGFEGVIMTDDLVMGAISKRYTYPEAAKKAVKAGVDILLISSNDTVDEIQHVLYAAVASGEIDERRIDASLMRILKLKYKYLKTDPQE